MGITKVPTTYSLAITSLSQLVQSACIAESRITSFPVHVFGEFCTPESEIVQEVLIPYLARTLHKTPQTKMEEEVRNIHLVALGLIRHKNVIPELTPVIDSRLSVSTSTVEGSRNSAARVLAVWSLMSVGYQNPHLVIPVLTNVFTNPAEDIGQDRDDKLWVLDTDAHEGVDSKDPGSRVPVSTSTVEGS